MALIRLIIKLLSCRKKLKKSEQDYQNLKTEYEYLKFQFERAQK